jgi:galactokinase
MKNKLIKVYQDKFGTTPEMYFTAPCRINLIGEHTDYNGGLAMPAAISKYIYAVVSKRNDRKIFLKSLEKRKEVLVDLDKIKNKKENSWGNYPLGIFHTLLGNGFKLPFGLNIIYGSNVPIASGLSSSAALLDLTAFIASTMYKLDMSKVEIALLAHQSETEFNGLQCGTMDELAISLGKKDKAIMLNCLTSEYKYQDLILDEETSLVVIVSNLKRQLIASPYNQRVAECKEGLSIIKKEYDIDNLSQVKVSDLPMVRKLIKDDIIYKRVRHVVTENERVRQFYDALNGKDYKKMYELLNASHISLRDDYEVTGEYLDFIHDKSLKYGALAERMTGAGFGGSSIAIIKKKDFASFKKKLTNDYYAKFKIKPLIFLAEISDGLTSEKI